MQRSNWCVVHWLTGAVKRYGSRKECREWASKKSYNKDAPIYYAFPVAGIVLHEHIHEHTHKHIEKPAKKVKQQTLKT
jgi:hypothetical protein